jgi:hypothetical protein
MTRRRPGLTESSVYWNGLSMHSASRRRSPGVNPGDVGVIFTVALSQAFFEFSAVAFDVFLQKSH